MDGLTKLFGGEAKMKLLRLFLVNDDTTFSLTEVIERTGLTSLAARKALANLSVTGLIKKVGAGKKLRYGIDRHFKHLDALRALFLATATVSHEKIGTLMKGCGAVKLLVLSGIFTNALDAGADVLIVGDRMNEALVEKAMKKVEASIGRELRYVILGGDEFHYRTSVYDRLVRDILEYPNVIVIDKIGVTE
jgi:hypothetical protein